MSETKSFVGLRDEILTRDKAVDAAALLEKGNQAIACYDRQITLENVGPVKRCTLPVPKGGGVVVLRGRNGSGKTHVLNAVQALVSGDGSLPVRDGQGRASVEGLGVTLRVGKRAARSGELEVTAIEGGVDPSTLVDPGIQDPEKADAQRVKALLTLARAEARPEQFNGLMPGVELPLGDETDPVKLAAIAKRAYQARARDSEQEAELAKREAAALESDPEGYRYDGPTDPQVLQSQLEAATRRKMELEAAARANEAATIRANEALARVRVLSHGHDTKLRLATEQRDAAQAEWDNHERIVADLKQQLADALVRRDEAEKRTEQAAANVESLESAGRTILELEAEVNKASGIVPVDTEAITEAAEAVTAATDNIRRAQLKRQHEAQIERCREAKVRSSTAGLAARDAREAAAKCDDVLSSLIDTCGTGLRFDGGRLRLATDRGPDELYADLSHGERWRIAIDVCVTSVGAEGLIVIPQEAWEGLDPIARKQIAQHCREVSATAVTAEADACEMSVEVL